MLPPAQAHSRRICTHSTYQLWQCVQTVKRSSSQLQHPKSVQDHSVCPQLSADPTERETAQSDPTMVCVSVCMRALYTYECHYLSFYIKQQSPGTNASACKVQVLVNQQTSWTTHVTLGRVTHVEITSVVYKKPYNIPIRHQLQMYMYPEQVTVL